MVADALAQAAALVELVATQSPLPPHPELTEAVLACARELLAAGEGAVALPLLESLRRSHDEPGAALDLRVAAEEAEALMAAARDDEALERLQAVQARQPLACAHDTDEALRLRVLEARALRRLCRLDESLALLDALQARLGARGHGTLAAQVAAQRSSAWVQRADWERAREASLEAWVIARRAGAEPETAIALGNLCIAERGRCRWAGSTDAGLEAVERLTRLGRTQEAAGVRRSLAITLWKRGRLTQALEHARESFAATRQGPRHAPAQYARLLEALVHLHAGHAADAREVLDSLARSTRQESRPEWLRLEALGDVELECGHVERALAHYDDALAQALALVPRGDVVAELRRRRAEVFLRQGRALEAHAEALASEALCRELGDRYEEAACQRTLALAAAELGRPDEARRHFERGFALFDEIETPYEWGRLWLAHGDWLAGGSAGPYACPLAARESYRAACDHLEAMGATSQAALARQRRDALEARLREDGVIEPAPGERPRPLRRPSGDRDLHRRVQWAFDTFGVVTRHRPLLELLEQVARVAPSDLPVLVLGESGTGKELLARGVHALSGRTGRLVEVNCSAVPATMMESEFFGSVQGAYTGSTRDRTGLFEESDGGSVFLDEVGEMPVELQAKLLRFLETGEVRRIGANGGRRVDARLIAATNREAARMQAGEGFRQDLYYRLAHAVFTLPPLRGRGDDVALLTEHFLERFTAEQGKPVSLSRAARERLSAHAWPGNVRELRALLQRLVVQSPPGHVVTPRELPLLEPAGTARNFEEEMVQQEKSRILDALQRAQWIKADAARALRLSRTTLLGKMKRYGIEA